MRADRWIIAAANKVALALDIFPQTIAREALRLGLVELARIAGVDLGKVVLTENAGTGEKHLELFYPANPQSQEKSVNNQAAAAV